MKLYSSLKWQGILEAGDTFGKSCKNTLVACLHYGASASIYGASAGIVMLAQLPRRDTALVNRRIFLLVHLHILSCQKPYFLHRCMNERDFVGVAVLAMGCGKTW